MKLSGEEYLRVSRLRSSVPVLGSLATAPARRNLLDDGIDAREIKMVTDAVTQQPEVREQVVASLRERIEAGTYVVSGQEIAEMLLRRLLADRMR